MGHLVGGVVDQDVELAEILDRALDQPPAVRRVLDVAGDENCTAPGLLDPPSRFLRVLVLLQIRNQHVGALAREGDRDRASDPRIGAGNQGGPPGEPATAAIGMLAMVRLWLELAGMARRLLLLTRQGRGSASGLRISCHRIIRCKRNVRAQQKPQARVPFLPTAAIGDK